MCVCIYTYVYSYVSGCMGNYLHIIVVKRICQIHKNNFKRLCWCLPLCNSGQGLFSNCTCSFLAMSNLTITFSTLLFSSNMRHSSYFKLITYSYLRLTYLMLSNISNIFKFRNLP